MENPGRVGDHPPNLEPEVSMKKTETSKFSWCPVCMVHTYFRKVGQGWECLNKDHQAFLRFRTDPWIEQYRQEKVSLQVDLEKGS